MKKGIWIIVTALLSLGAIIGANALVSTTNVNTMKKKLSTEEQIKIAPKAAVDSATVALKKALSQQNAPAVIAALVKQSAAQLLIDRDSLPAIIDKTTALADRSENPVEQSLLRLLTAQMYNLYLDRNYQIRWRDEINDFSLPVESWSKNMFTEKIDTLLAQATAPAEALQNTPIESYREALSIGTDSLFRPTLYDFVLNEAIEIYEGMDEYSRIQPLVRQKLLSPAKEFTTAVFSGKTVKDNRILQLYADALKFHAADELSAPFMMWDLNRLEYLGEDIYFYDESSAYYDYIGQLKTILDAYRAKPYSVEIATVLVSKLRESGKYDDAQQALDICDRWIKDFPKYRRINALKNQRNGLTGKEASFNLPNVSYPGQTDSVELSFRNVDTLTVNIYRQPDTLSFYAREQYRPQQNDWDRSNCVYTHKYGLNRPLSLIPDKKKIAFPHLAPGYYVVEMLIDGKPGSSTVNHTVSGIKTIVRSAGEKSLELLAVDAQTGKPIQNADVTVYTAKNRSYEQVKEISRLKTDKNGLCIIDTNDTRYYAFAQISTPTDGYSPLADLSYTDYWDRYDKEKKTALFSDRSLYRPGQTVYFSGIRYVNNTEESRVIPREKCTVRFIDPSSRTLSTLEMTTDEYGQFNGSFVVPQGNMLGNYTIQVDGSWANALSISVAEYKLPMFKVEFDPVKEGTSFGKPLTIKGSAVSYSEVPQAGAEVEYTISRRTNPFFRLYLPHEQIASGSSVVDKAGNFAITFTPKRESSEENINKEQAYIYTVTATITAPTGETVEQSVSVQVGDSPYFISISAPQYIDKYKSAGQIKAEIHTLNGQTVQRACRLVFYSLYDSDEESLDSLKIKMQVGEVLIAADGKAVYPDFTKWQSGPYRIVAFSDDETGRIIRNETNFVLYSDKDKRPPRFAGLWLPRTELTTEAGETVKIPIGSSFKNAYVFYSVYTPDSLIETKMIKLDNRCKTIDFKFDDSFGGLATISLLTIKEGEMTTAQATIRTAAPDKRLDIKTASFRDKLLPGSLENWTFSITDTEGNPVSARFMTEMFDASMQAIRTHRWNFNVPTPIPSLRISTTPRTEYTHNYSIRIYDFAESSYCPIESSTEFLNFGLLWYGKARPLMARSAAQSEGYDIADFREVIGEQPVLEECVVTELSSAQKGVAVENKAISIADIAGTEESAADSYRTSEVGTAFFYPTLMSDSLGNVSVSFTVPNENATWQFYALAYTSDLFTGRYEAQTISSKPLMVSPNLPRFVRQGDEVTVSTAIQNRTDKVQEGTILFELFDPYTEKVSDSRKFAFIVDAGESRTVDYSFSVPEGIEVLGFRTKASTLQHSDGEQQILPVLPAKVLVTDSKPFYIPGGKHSTSITWSGMDKKMKSPTVENYRMVLQYCDNPVWYAVQALPPLADLTGDDAISAMASLFSNSVAVMLANSNPRIAQAIESWKATGGKNLSSLLAQNEELKQVLLSATPWVLEADNQTERMQQLSTLFDKNRAERLTREAILKLHNLQTTEGGWSWFSGMKTNFLVSINTLEGFSRLRKLGIPLDESEIKEMQISAVAYLDKMIVNQKKKNPDKNLSYEDICYLYVRSSYRDIPLAGETLDLHKKMVEKLRYWVNLSTIEKAYAATALYRYGFVEDAKDILKSLRQYAVSQPAKGMYWPNNRSHYYYNNSAVQEQCALFNAFSEIEPVTSELDAMRQWLLSQKQTNDWGAVPSTLEAIYALLEGGTDWLAPDENKTSIVWGGQEMKNSPEEPFLGLTEYTLSGNEISAAAAKAVISTDHEQPSWGAMYWQYYDDVKNVTSASVEDLALSRQIVVRQQGVQSATYVPLNRVTLKTGDRIAIRLTISVGRDMQFVCLTDSRAACFEPTEQLSGYKCRERICYYEEVKNTETRFYFDFLPKGTYVISYELDVDRPGEYTQGLSTIQCLYAPQIIARTPAQTIIIK